eukprot:TRINITY_DN14798_c0_g1_i1.p1 TRINITY_DN14798_c0_g1~~TRINITY_DN14798_c0_g1_i1.p1  ORF type:complete len:355 (+),score=66.02 TRINITY_DN14798_c0_g1_i1:41-1066(+)
MMDPFSMDPYGLDAFREYLSKDDLKRICGTDDLEGVKVLETQIDSVGNSIEGLGHKLPSVTELRLTGSYVESLRDLGTSLKKVDILWLSRSGIRNLGGATVGFPYLSELYISYNSVKDLSPLGQMKNLQVLDAEHNRISEIQNVSFLSNCTSLHSLNLEGNPVSESAGYRSGVFSSLPFLIFLDDSDLQEEIHTDAFQAPDGVDEKMRKIEESLRVPAEMRQQPFSAYVEQLLEDERKAVEDSTEPTEEERLLEELNSVVKRVKDSRFVDPCSLVNLSDDEEESVDLSDDSYAAPGGTSAAELREAFISIQSDASHLTHHTPTIFCGNVTKILRSRKRQTG